MKTVTSLLLVALLVASAYADCVTRGPVDVYVGDHAVLDSVISCSGNLQSLSLPATQLGGHDALTFEVEVKPTEFRGCVFSYGSGANYVALGFAPDNNNALGQVHFTVGGRTASTQGVVTANQWHNIAVIVRNNAAAQGAVPSDATVTIIIDGISYPAQTVDVLAGGDRQGHLGYCAATQAYFPGSIDNLIITSKAKDTQELADTRGFIYPFVLENDLVQMWGFNDDGTTTSAKLGNAAGNLATINLAAGPDSSFAAVCSRVPKDQGKKTDVFCTQSGSVKVASGSTVDSISNVAMFQDFAGGLSSSFNCKAGAEFTFNQKWSNGGVTEATLKTSLNHRFRVAANVDGPLVVEHQNWGGWTRLSAGSGIIREDRTAFSISETEFIVQAANYGWISFTQNGAYLNYQYALDKDACAEATCEYRAVEEFQYNFNNPPLPEPMGNQATTDGILGLPPVLACPPPELEGYNPFMYCWGWWIGPQVGYTRDWNGRPWQTSDPGCCRNNNLNSQWSYARWGSMVQGMTLPWCTDTIVPPIAPPKGVTTIPTYPTDPCEGITTAEKNSFKAICSNLWGSDETDGRYIGCVAQLCITKDPTTVPPPDCPTERLLKSLDSNYQMSAKCNNDCPSDCSFRGTCNAGVCTCQAGWAGPSCGQPTEYPCIEAAGSPVLPFQLRSLDSQFPNAPVLTQTMGDAIYTQYSFPGKYKIADSVFVYLAQSVAAYDNPAPTYHLWVVANNRAGSRAGDVTVTITTPTVLSTSDPATTDIDLFSGATPVAGVGAATSGTYPGMDRRLTAAQFSVRLQWGAGDISGFVLRKLPVSLLATVAVTSNAGPLPQVLIGGTSASQKAAMDVFRVSNSLAATGFQIKGLGASDSTKCAATNTCANLNCGTCTATAGCGWCVETSQCQPGSASGPAFGLCSNWRSTFDLGVTRRVTTIPSYPANPGLTEVVLTTAVAADTLPIELSVTPTPADNSEWDVIHCNDFKTITTTIMRNDVKKICSKIQRTNMLYAVASVVPGGFEVASAGANTNAGDQMQTFIDTLPASKISTANTVDVAGALAKLVLPTSVGSLKMRGGAKKVVVFTSTADHSGAVPATTAEKLLLANIVPVFCVPAGRIASYTGLKNSIGFGQVFELDVNNIADCVNRAVLYAGSSVIAAIPPTHLANTHVDAAAYTANNERFTIANLPENMRARFTIPVLRNGAQTAENSIKSTSVVFPGYGTAKVENIPVMVNGAIRAERPWTTNANKYSLLSNDAPVVIELTGMSFRGLMAVSPKIMTLPSASAGVLFRAVRKVVNGAPAWVQGDAVAAGDVIADGRVVFAPQTGINAVQTTSFTYNVFDKCISSADGTISIEVTPANRAPQADMPNMVTAQATPLVFSLDFGDDKKATNGQYNLRIVDTVASNDGQLFQYYENFNPANPDLSKLIGDNTVLTANQLIYLPPKFKYSTAINPALLILPCFSYQVEETAPVGDNLISNTKQVLITVTHVNTAPFVWQQAGFPTDILGDWTVYDPSEFCFDTCTFDEDFGQQFWWETGFETIYLGGNDVEGSDLTFEFTEVDCFPGSILVGDLSTLKESSNIKVGDKLVRNAPGVLHGRLSFRPAPETSNVHNTGKDYYCKISYRAIDDQDAVSAAVKTITININDVNKQPHLEEAVKEVDALEQQKKSFFLEAVDPEGDAFSVEFHGCSKNQGVIELCTDKDCGNTITLDCSMTYPATPVVLQNAIITLDSGATGFLGFFTSGPVENFAEGYQYNTIYLALKDSVSAFPATNAQVIFNVKIINNAPKLTINGDDVEEISFQVDISRPFRPEIVVYDVDFGDREEPVMTVTLTLDAPNTPALFFPVEIFNQATAPCPDSREVTENKVVFTCNIRAVNAFLAQFQLQPPAIIDSDDAAVLTITANDNGFSGQCPETTGVVAQSCPMEDTVVMKLTFATIQDTSSVVVASSAAAAGVAGAAAIAAVALFRKFNKKAEDSYAPWDGQDNDDSTAVNPLYQESGSKGVNALYEAKNEL